MNRAAQCAVCEVHAESVFRVDGMDCHEEVAILERRLKGLAGLEALSADVIGQRLLVKYDAARLSTAAISDAVADTGMRAWLEHEESRAVDTSPRRLPLLVVSAAALAAGLLLEWNAMLPAAAVALFLLSAATAGVYPARRALASVRARHVDIHVLMAIAVAGALAIGQWSEAGSVVFLFALAQYLESRSMDRARQAIRTLMDLAPVDAIVLRDGREVRLPVDDVDPGALVRVRPGDKVPLDGVIVAGSSEVNQAPITGESLPVDRHPGDELFAGSINGRGALDMRVTRVRRDTTLARIIHMVEEAQAQRAPSQTFVERFARYYTPAVIALAVLVALVPPAFFAQPFGDWFYRALVLLVISCPCALVISTPVSIVSALAAAARHGVLIKGGVHLERTGSVRCVAFDKTGTLTRGDPDVLDVVPFDGEPAARVLALAASVESRSEHPIARAIVRRARTAAVDTPPALGFQALPGRGGEASVGGTTVSVGNLRFFRERGWMREESARAVEQALRGGRTAVLVAADGRTIGMLLVADRPRDRARDVVALLRDHGVPNAVMLTGDHRAVAEAIGRELGITDVRSDLLPEDKVAAVEQCKRTYGVTAMVGDGVNDAPALAAADVGIVMGAAGSAAALETADVALMGDDLSKIPFTIRLSRAAVANIRMNVAVSLGLKALFLALAVTGYATLWMAILADTGASLLVIGNGLRLLGTR